MTGRKESVRPFELDPDRATVEFVEEHFSPPVPVRPTVAQKTKRRWTPWLWGIGAAGALGAILTQAVSTTVGMLNESLWTGLPFALFIGLVGAAALGLFGREYAAYRRLKRQDHIHAEAERLAVSELHGGSDGIIGELESRYGDIAASEVRRYRTLVNDSLNDGERLRLFEKTVLAGIDKQAHRIVLASSRDIGLLTALSPLGLLDGLLVLWRTLVMTRQIAELYGLRPSAVAGFALLRRSLRNAILAGVADVVSHAAIEHVGAGLLALLSARAGQGAGNALLAARLGLETIRQVRPLAFVEMSEPRLADIRKALLDDKPSSQHEAEERN